MKRLASVRLAVLALVGAGLAGADSLSTSISAPNGSGIPTLGGTDNQVYELQFAKAAVKAQADYGVLRAYIWSNVGFDPYWNGESLASVHFDDRLTVNSPAAGFLKVEAMTEGSIVYADSIYNEQSFYLQWVITNLTTNVTSTCYDHGTYASVPALPLDCVMQFPLDAGSTSIYIAGTLQIYNRGMASATSMDLFHTAAVTGIGVTDGVNVIPGVSITAQSGTTYSPLSPLSAVPEPGTWLLMSTILLILVGRLRQRIVSE